MKKYFLEEYHIDISTYHFLIFDYEKKKLNIALHNKKQFRSYSPFSEKEAFSALSKVKDFFVLIVIYLIGGQEHTLG